MKIVVTGGNGFVGKHLVKALKKRKYKVRILSPTSGYYRGDIRDKKLIKKAVSWSDMVYHLAAQTNIKKSFENPKFDYSINYIGTKNVLNECISQNKKFVFTSSSAIFGNTPFGKHKLLAERLALKYKKSIVFRIYNIYGKGGWGVVNKFISLHKNNQPITIFNNLHFVRDFIHIKDALKALLYGLKDYKDSTLFNVGTGIGTSIAQLIQLLEKISGKKVKIAYSNEKLKGEVARSICPEGNRLPKKFIKLEDGLKELWKEDCE